MSIEVGEKVHIIERRAFETDVRRHFLGEVIAKGPTTIRVHGHVFVFDEATGEFKRHADARTRVIPLADARVNLIVLPPEADLTKVRYEHSADGNLYVSDGTTFSLAINEFGFRR